MVVHKILAADTRFKGAKKFPKVGMHTRVTAVRLTVALYSLVHSNGARGPDADKDAKYFGNDARARTHTHTHIYIYIYIYIYILSYIIQ
jgi:hypothetical protein